MLLWWARVAPDGTADNRVAIAAVPGALEALVALVATGSPGAQETAARALHNLAFNGACVRWEKRWGVEGDLPMVGRRPLARAKYRGVSHRCVAVVGACGSGRDSR